MLKKSRAASRTPVWLFLINDNSLHTNEYENGVGSIPVWITVDRWIVRSTEIQHMERNLTKYWDPSET